MSKTKQTQQVETEIRTDRPGNNMVVLTVTENGVPVSQFTYSNQLGSHIAMAILAEFHRPDPKSNILKPTGGPNAIQLH